VSVIKVEHLTYIYGEGMPDATVALNDVSFEVERGEFLGVIGPTGCGKSTLITHFNGLNRPTKGKLLIDGEDIWAQPKQIRRYRFKVGLVFQYPEYQLFEETVRKDISFGPRNMGLPEEEINQRVEEAARFCGLSTEMLERSPFELSGGQKRRAAIAGVLAMRPEVLVLDEPAAGLDPEGREMILSQVKEYHKQTGATIVLVSHSMEDIAKYADRVLVLQGGEIAMLDTTANIFARADELVALGLSVPEVTKIFLQLRAKGIAIPTDVYTVKYGRDILLDALKRKGGGQHA
jgi:energy-coupling factor transport system ATP-binding protein